MDTFQQAFSQRVDLGLRRYIVVVLGYISQELILIKMANVLQASSTLIDCFCFFHRLSRLDNFLSCFNLLFNLFIYILNSIIDFFCDFLDWLGDFIISWEGVYLIFLLLLSESVLFYSSRFVHQQVDLPDHCSDYQNDYSNQEQY